MHNIDFNLIYNTLKPLLILNGMVLIILLIFNFVTGRNEKKNIYNMNLKELELELKRLDKLDKLDK